MDTVPLDEPEDERDVQLRELRLQVQQLQEDQTRSAALLETQAKEAEAAATNAAEALVESEKARHALTEERDALRAQLDEGARRIDALEKSSSAKITSLETALMDTKAEV